MWFSERNATRKRLVSVVAVLAFVAALFVLWAIFQCYTLSSWLATLALIGLIVNGTGAVLLFIADDPSMNQRLMTEDDEQKINVLERARDNIMLIEESINRVTRDKDEEVVEIIDSLWREKVGVPYDVETKGIDVRNTQYSSGVSPIADMRTSEIDYTLQKQTVASVAFWIEEKIEGIRRKNMRKVRRSGAFLLILGFLLQICASIVRNTDLLYQFIGSVLIC